MRPWLLAGGVIAALVTGLLLGAVSFGPAALWRGLTGADSEAAAILWGIRAPRALLAFLVGGALGVAGASLQALVRNPLADPYLLGISGGAGLGAVSAIALGLAAAWALPAFAFAGGLVALVVVYRLAVAAGRLDPRTHVLAGVVVGSFAGALTSAILVLSDAARLRNAFLWLLGGFSAASWPAVAVFAAYAIPAVAALFILGRRLDLLALGEESAAHLGVDVDGTRRGAYVAAGLVAGAAVAVSGVVGFVGLVAPHAMRRLVGPLHARLLPAVFAGAGAFLVLADVVARTVVRPIELPVGVVTALVGVPVFAAMLRRGTG
ncbi:MAG TPA: iron ABC transporter permease [Gemmatimonadales bacterium]|nr:iron ABC transporter permease [Gemmatimonadales bacterium]